MSTRRIRPDGLAGAITEELSRYKDATTSSVKDAVRQTAAHVKKDIAATAPKDTGAYKKSWATKITKETSAALAMTVYSRNRYQLAHLLEYGHATRGGSRVPARPHIGPAEERGVAELQAKIRQAARG